MHEPLVYLVSKDSIHDYHLVEPPLCFAAVDHPLAVQEMSGAVLEVQQAPMAPVKPQEEALGRVLALPELIVAAQVCSIPVVWVSCLEPVVASQPSGPLVWPSPCSSLKKAK